MCEWIVVVFTFEIKWCNGWLSWVCFFFFKQKTAYEMRISDWSSDVCSSDLGHPRFRRVSGRPSARPKSPVRDVDARRHATRRSDRHRLAGDTVSLGGLDGTPRLRYEARDTFWVNLIADRKSVGAGKSVSVRVDLGGRRISKKKKQLELINQ